MKKVLSLIGVLPAPFLLFKPGTKGKVIEFFSFSILPVVSLAIIPDVYDFVVLLTTFVIVCFIVGRRIRSGEWSWYSIGFRFDRMGIDTVLYLSCCIIGFLSIMLSMKVQSLEGNFFQEKYIKYSLLGSPMQEFLYRAYLVTLGVDIFCSVRVNLFLNIVLFTGMHWFFPNLPVVLPMVFIGGIMFTLLYWFRPNFVLICVVHIVLNAGALYAHVFQKQGSFSLSCFFLTFFSTSVSITRYL